MTVIWPLHAGFGITAPSVCNHTIKRQAHDLSKQLADLVFSEFVFGGEVEDLWEGGLVFGLEVFGCDV